MNIHKIRLANLQRIINEDFNGNSAALARALGDQPSTVYRFFNENESTRRNIGAAKAREIEKAARRPNGFLDVPRDSVVLETEGLDKRKLVDAVKSVVFHLKAAGKLDSVEPEVIAKRIAALYISDGDMQKALDEIQDLSA